LLENLISTLQGGFVKGGHLIDNVVQVKEALHSSHSQKEKGMIIKLDMSNAFNGVKLSFLYKNLLSFGFSANFINLIKASTHRPWIAPLVNGRPSDFFQASRGLHQGCPLSPFLYIFLAESLRKKLKVEMDSGAIPGIKATRCVNPINHALFEDDSLLLGGASVKISKAFKEILQQFCLITGALINKRKSIVYGWNVDHPTMLRISCMLGFPGFDKWEKIKYLGLPLILGPSSSSLWVEVINKIKNKIAYSGGQWLTKAGKLVLIKAVLFALPIFQSSLLLAPMSITNQISKILRNFLSNGGKGNHNNFHLVRWKILNRPL